MRFYAETLGLSENAFVLLRDLVHERTGLFFENGKRDLLADKLSPCVVERGLQNFLDYYYLLKYDASADAEWRRVIDALSVQETYFWREIDQVRALVDVIVPQHFAAHPLTPLRIWSAACATGEEPLTIAMVLNEAGWFQRAPIEIFASDASPSALSKAKRGMYRDRSFRSLSESLKAKYFVPVEGGWQIDMLLHARVKWSLANLVARDEIAALAQAHVIFCRNVFIYFSDQTIRKVVRTFYEQMPTPAYLFVGASESLLKLTTDFGLQEIGGAFVYVKCEA
jgi:chemotaxis protein methyltransferase CheR